MVRVYSETVAIGSWVWGVVAWEMGCLELGDPSGFVGCAGEPVPSTCLLLLSQDLLSRFGVDPASLQGPGNCPQLVTVKRRSLVDNPDLLRPAQDNQ